MAKAYVIVSDYEQGQSVWVRPTLASALQEAKALLREELGEVRDQDEETADEIEELLHQDKYNEAHLAWHLHNTEYNPDYVDSINVYECDDNGHSGNCILGNVNDTHLFPKENAA